MKYKNSYIFLKRKKEEKQANTISDNKIVISSPATFDDLFQKSFNDISFSKKNSIDNFVKSGNIIVHKKNSMSKAKYEYHKVGNNYYLDIYVNDTKDHESDVIELLSNINERLIGIRSIINEEYIHIITNDYVSEYYCNKLYPSFNVFDRKLRKILTYVYTLHFDLDYYQSTIDKQTVENLKSGSSQMKQSLPEFKNKNTKKNDEDVQYAFYALEYKDIENILFEKKVKEYDINKLKKFLDRNDDLSVLTDEKLRSAYEQCMPRSDWERFFKNKKIIIDFEDLLKKIHKYRNDVMHCKIITKKSYKDCAVYLKNGIKSLDIAIDYIEHEDFRRKNTLSRIESVERMGEILLKAAESIAKMQSTLNPMFANLLDVEKGIVAGIDAVVKNMGINQYTSSIYETVANGMTVNLASDRDSQTGVTIAKNNK